MLPNLSHVTYLPLKIIFSVYFVRKFEYLRDYVLETVECHNFILYDEEGFGRFLAIWTGNLIPFQRMFFASSQEKKVHKRRLFVKLQAFCEENDLISLLGDISKYQC